MKGPERIVNVSDIPEIPGKVERLEDAIARLASASEETEPQDVIRPTYLSRDDAMGIIEAYVNRYLWGSRE